MPSMLQRWKLLRKREQLLKQPNTYKTVGDDGLFSELDEASAIRRRELRGINRQLAELATNDLLKEAARFDIPVPTVDPPDLEEFEETPEFRAQLRKSIDDEKTRRREVTAWWWTKVVIPAISIIIGLIGAITGLVAVLHRR